MHPECAQAGAFLPKLLEQAGLLKEAETTNDAGGDAEESAKTVGEEAEKAEEGREQEIMRRYAETDEAISKLNVVLVYKKVVQGLIYSPPDCDKYLALDAKPQVSVALPLDCGTQRHIRDGTVPKPVWLYKRPPGKAFGKALPYAVSLLQICCEA